MKKLMADRMGTHTKLSHSEEEFIPDIRKLFMAALFLGVTGIVIPQSIGFNFLSVMIPLLLMTIYSGIGYQKSKESQFLEQFADSVYYLGFLFTLIALVVSLYHYRDSDLEIDSIIANFSLALITTIFGLAVRITINNFQVDLPNAERQMLKGVELAANDFVRKAKTLSMQLELSHDETQRAIRQAIVDATSGINKATKLIENHTESSTKTLTAQLDFMKGYFAELKKDLEKSIQTTEFPEDIFVRRLETPIDLLVQDLTETRKLFSELNVEHRNSITGFNEIQQTITGMHEILKDSVNTLTAFNQALTDNQSVFDRFLLIGERTEQFTKDASKMTDHLNLQAIETTKVTEKLNDLIHSLGGLPETAENISNKLNGSAEKFIDVFERIADRTDQGRKIGNSLEIISDALAKSQLTVEQISNFGLHVTSAFKRLEAFNKTIEMHSQNLQQLGEVAHNDVELIRQHQTELADILELSRTTMSMFNRQFVESIEYINKSRQI